LTPIFRNVIHQARITSYSVNSPVIPTLGPTKNSLVIPPGGCLEQTACHYPYTEIPDSDRDFFHLLQNEVFFEDVSQTSPRFGARVTYSYCYLSHVVIKSLLKVPLGSLGVIGGCEGGNDLSFLQVYPSFRNLFSVLAAGAFDTIEGASERASRPEFNSPLVEANQDFQSKVLPFCFIIKEHGLIFFATPCFGAGPCQRLVLRPAALRPPENEPSPPLNTPVSF